MRKTIVLWTLLVTLFDFFAATATAQDSNNAITHQVQPGEHLLSLSLQHNVCIDAIKATNPNLIFGAQYDPLPSAEIKIPTDTPECYERYIAQEGETPLEISEKFNICPEILGFFNHYFAYRYFGGTGLMGSPIESPHPIAIPQQEPPCYNPQGQRLYYHYQFLNDSWNFIGEYISLTRFTGNDDIAQSIGVCPSEVINTDARQLFLKDIEQSELCDFIAWDKQISLSTIARQHNICLFILADINRSRIWHPNATLGIPRHSSPCYAEDALNTNRGGDTTYVVQPNEFLVDVALKFQLCMADLLAANPHRNPSNYWFSGQEINIPDIPFCNYPQQHILINGNTLTYLSVIYNICINRIVDANPELITTGINERTTIVIPERPPCYNNSDYNFIKMREYVCYAQEIDFEADYSGHDPVISPVALDVKDNFCYERGDWATTVIYENEPITAYRIRPYDTMSQVAACFNIDVNDLIAVNNQEYTYEVRPYGYWVLPPDYDRNCPLLTMSRDEYQQYMNALSNRAGYISQGVYVVNHQDTLSSIGKEFGYLPEWIAAENGLENPDMIFYLQELKLPSYPNYWQLATIGGGVLATVSISSTLSLLLRWRRRKPKRKNITAEKF